ncbi:MAG: P pilus assembly/Cpx signaling pathway, periplasmic inhibitor/zinc-resistance associated protein, partial [Nostocales cyanobacterium 94392]|nr:P pilus assembly/Cpx signaling pathway, periplasmic inhibitor/zinc-resistance associated protein [Nostocales cyanobacterium 94392]
QRSNQINAVLTPSQRIQLKQALKSGQNYNQAVQSLNLTAEQNQRITLVNNAANLKVKLIGNQ